MSNFLITSFFIGVFCFSALLVGVYVIALICVFPLFVAAFVACLLGILAIGAIINGIRLLVKK